MCGFCICDDVNIFANYANEFWQRVCWAQNGHIIWSRFWILLGNCFSNAFHDKENICEKFFDKRIFIIGVMGKIMIIVNYQLTEENIRTLLISTHFSFTKKNLFIRSMTVPIWAFSSHVYWIPMPLLCRIYMQNGQEYKMPNSNIDTCVLYYYTNTPVCFENGRV